MLLLLLPASTFAQNVLTRPIIASSDDAEERGANASSNPGLMDLTSSDLELVEDGNDGDQFVGMRFTSVNIPQGAIITNAYIQFTVDEDDDVPGDKFIFVELSDDATTFTSTAFDISSRPRSTDSVIWSNIPIWNTVGAAGADQQTPDLSTLIQLIIDRPGWQSGNALNVILTGTGERVAESYDGDLTAAPTLIVEYLTPQSGQFQVMSSSDDAEERGANAASNPGLMDLTSSDLELVEDGNDGDQYVGMRFTGVSIPQGAVITHAYIQFTVDEDDDVPGDKFIFVEPTDDATTFTSTAFDISSRPRSADSVIWSGIPIWNTVGAAGADQQTPDLTALIQSIIDRPGWQSGNALNVIITGTGERVAESYDGASTSAPVLVVDYASAVQPPFPTGGFPLTAGSLWKYDDSGQDLGTAWTAPGYQDSAWAYGPAILGYGNGNESTILDFGGDPANKHITTYLRHNFDVANPGDYASLKFRVLRDDGVVIYLNGVEVLRQNMPSGPVTYQTLSSTTVAGVDEITYFEEVLPNTLVAGENVLAVELHQRGPTSSDLSFDLEVEGIEPQGLVRSGEWQPQESFDDVEEDAPGTAAAGTMYMNSSDLELTFDGVDQVVGIRFPNINIPEGSNILNAHVQFTVDETTNTPGTLYIKGEDTDSSALFSITSFDVTDRDTTDASVTWDNIPNWTTVGAAGPDQQTPDIAAIIQEIVDRPGWKAGNAMAIIISGDGERVAESYDGSPSQSPKLVVTYELTQYQNGEFPITPNSLWKYDTTGTDLGSSWKDMAYADSAWDFGPGILGYGNGNELTTLDFGADPSNKYPTHYLRNTFDVTDANFIDSLRFKVLRDDGVVVYVNGVESFRQNMPSGPVTFNTFAASTVGGSDELTYFETVVPSTLVDGENLIAVEVHQRSGTSSDLSFDLEVNAILGPPPIDTFPLARESVWSYLDNGVSLDSVNWTDLAYDFSDWAYQYGDFGFGDGQNTELTPGFITYYFRKNLYIADYASLTDSLLMFLKRDDGPVVYVNGVEVARYNLPSGPIGYDTLALGFVDNEAGYQGFIIPKSAFQPGLNALAVEMHNASAANIDLAFDMELKELFLTPGTTCDPSTNDHIGCFVSIDPRLRDQVVRIPSTHRLQVLMQQGDAYTKGGGNIPGNHDFTGYAPYNNESSTQGYLSVNHEISPVGGVSILDLHFALDTNLWVVDTTQAVDFTHPALGGRTATNCSGGVTPWGTILTAEEYPNITDVNSDGYHDVGWIVEIDPAEAKVRDHGTGTPTKLYAMGWISHENAAPAPDSVTVYMGEDGGTSCVYKFVADNKMDLRSGDLYVLSLDDALDSNGDPTGTTGRWIQVPNTTQNERNNTRTLAAQVGGTFFNSVEDVEVGTVDGQIYFTSKGNGRIYRFANASDSTVEAFEAWVGGQSYPILTESEIVFTDFGFGIDNLAFDDLGNLYGMQDGGEDHIWVIRPEHTQENPQVDIFMTTPAGSEPTGMTFSPDYRYMFVSMQHPSGSNTQTQLDAALEEITYDRAATLVIARAPYLGAQPPVADFTADAVSIEVGETITFTNTSNFLPDSLYWTFESGTPTFAINEESPVVGYSNAGTFEVSLEAYNFLGADTVTKTSFIEVVTSLPTVDLTGVKVYPNPFANQVKVAFHVEEMAPVRIALYDMTGRLVQEAYEGSHAPGQHVVQLDVAGSAPQVILLIEINGQRTARTLIRQ